jgi:hypothetical protein
MVGAEALMATAFVGPMSRFYTGSAEASPRLQGGVEAWREDLRTAVAAKIAAQLQWDEGAEVAAITDLGAQGWPALRLFAFYSERSELEFPDTVPPLLELDAHWRAAVDAKFAKSVYGQLLAASVWLPGDFPVTMRVPMPDGETAEVGSVAVLADQLRWLNQRTFQADAELLAAWQRSPAPPGGDLLAAARRGLAGLLAAVTIAQREGLPLLLREA